MSFGVCTCGVTGHAINCPLRPTTVVYGFVPLLSQEWLDGYNAGYAAGLAAAGIKIPAPEALPNAPHKIELTAPLERKSFR